MALNTESGIEAYLKQHQYACKYVTRLDEGFSSFVYRVSLEQPHSDSSNTVIVKHTTEYAARAKQYALDPSRLSFENNFLTLVSPLLPDSLTIGPFPLVLPRVHGFSADDHVLLMSDHFPGQALQHFLKNPKVLVTASDAAAIGSRLGTFLASVHNLTLDHDDIISSFEGNTSARALSAKAYFTNLAPRARDYGFPFTAEDNPDGDGGSWLETLTARQAEIVLGKDLTEDDGDEVLTVGDFWPGNVLVTELPHGAGRGLVALDFEYSKPGRASFDLGAMSAELWMLHHFELVTRSRAADGEEGGRAKNDESTPALAVLRSLLGSYKALARRPVDAAQVAIRIGAHLVTIGPMGREQLYGREKVVEIVRRGIELIRAAATSKSDAWTDILGNL